jgi:hypothetical protein
MIRVALYTRACGAGSLSDSEPRAAACTSSACSIGTVTAPGKLRGDSEDSAAGPPGPRAESASVRRGSESDSHVSVSSPESPALSTQRPRVFTEA